MRLLSLLGRSPEDGETCGSEFVKEAVVAEGKKRRKILFRKMTWALIVWTVLIVVWVVSAGASTGESVDECLADGFLTRAECQEAVDAGTGIGVFLIVVFGALVFLVLAAVWFMTRPRDDATRELAREMRLAREERERAASHSIDT